MIKNAKCPYCKQKLELSKEERRYEMLGDFNDGGYSRPYYECTCEDSKGIFWGAQGSLYVKNYEVFKHKGRGNGFKYRIPYDYHAHWKSELIGSWIRNYHMKKYYLRLFKLEKIIEAYRKYVRVPYLKRKYPEMWGK